jgi:DNA-binding NarL/FixJ family response regulator
MNGERSLIEWPSRVIAGTSNSCNVQRTPVWESAPMALRVVLVDDSRTFLAAASRLLAAEGLEVVGTASTGVDAFDACSDLLPDVVLVDIMLGSESGIDLARRLAEELPGGGPRVILVSTHSEEDFVDLIQASPAVGFVPKTGLSADAIRRVLASDPA